MIRRTSRAVHFLVVIVIATATGCGASSEIEEQAAISTVEAPQAPTQEPTEVPTEVSQAAVNSASGGLGLTGSEWRAAHGDPTGAGTSTSFAEEGWRVDHLEFANDTQPWNFTIRFNEPVDMTAAQAAVAKYIPADATMVDEYRRTSADSDVVLYHSEWLGEAMDGPWLDAEPGSLLVVYGWAGNDASTGIDYALISTSHSP